MPRELTLREIQDRELSILKRVAAWLEENGITYSLSGGTLLGAVRHSGFIPWDDDVDICVPRPDYTRMCELLRAQHCRVGKLEAHLPGSEGFYFSFVKFMDPATLSRGASGKGKGIPLRIDVFPMDRLPTDPKRYRGNMRMFRWLRCVLWSANRTRESIPELAGSGWKPQLKWRLCRIALALAGGYRGAARLLDAHARWIDRRNRNGKRWGNITWTSYSHDYFDAGDGEGFATELHAFEDAQFQIMRKYDQYLTVVYGDYMTPPPEDKRDVRHNRVAYLLDEDDGAAEP